ncbi:MAG TPA: LysR substrate-binding domain-containing protein [Cyclobacteriaceae bacterium]|nr:LysR substrate-binding domain-containing protein [Cyclobacteriaceae bacterium]HRJ83985.1 LysR substrate-binding domain-containing protein [Cyclobacteriaceae bacterium]
MNYTLHQLQIFLKVSQVKSITKAAEELHLTQPAVSIQLKNFQDQFDIPLTEVVGRKLFITEFGKEIAHAAENILNEVYAINFKSEAYRGQLAGRLKISTVSTGKYVMPYFLSDFLEHHPEVELELDVTNKSKVIESLENNTVDFSLVSILPKNLFVNRIELLQNKLYWVSSPEVKAKLKASARVTSILENTPLIYREAGSGTRQIMEKYINSKRLTIRRKLELTSNEAVKQAIIAGLGSSIMPLIGIRNELNNGQLQIIPVKGLPIKSQWQLISLKGKKFSPVAQAFISFLQREKTRIIKERFSWYEEYT